jgi:hypothetical protein
MDDEQRKERDKLRKEARETYQDLVTTYEHAAKNIVRAKKIAYPVGTIVTIRSGKGTADIRVTGHPTAWWNEPDALVGMNVRTDNQKRFTISQITDVKEEAP